MPASSQRSAAGHVIFYGWGLPDSTYVREHWREIEALPFDGTGITIPVDRAAWQAGHQSTKFQAAWQTMAASPLPADALAAAAADLAVPAWSRQRHDFIPAALSSSVSAEGLDWFDDMRWRTIADNFTALARLGRRARLRGILLDPEHYGVELFRFADQSPPARRSLPEFRSKARQRGREVMRAIAREWPDVVLLTLFGHSLPLSEAQRGTPEAQRPYVLLSDFYDGMLEVMPEQARFYDGFEFAYPFKRAEEFAQARQTILTSSRAMSSVPARFKAHVRAGFGIWLDYREEKGHFTPQEFSASVSAALAHSDGYVWIYTHRFKFFPPGDDALPYLNALREMRERPGP